VKLLDLEQPAADAPAQIGLGQILEDELGLEKAPEVAVGTVEAVLGAEGDQPLQSHRRRHAPAL
jgi:hypothetical protein